MCISLQKVYVFIITGSRFTFPKEQTRDDSDDEMKISDAK